MENISNTIISQSERNPEDHSAKTDAELAELAKSNPDFFGYLMERYKNPLSSYIRRITFLSQEDTADLLQEVFIKTYRHLNDYDPSLKFSSWIYRITHNHIIDTIRRLNSRPKTVSLDDDALTKIFAASTDIEKDIHIQDSLTKIRKSIESLPLQYREILILRFLEEKTYEEIMDILKKPKGSVASLINRGRKLLTESLTKEHTNF